MNLDDLADATAKRYPEQPEFLQASNRCLEELAPFIESHPEYQEESLLLRLLEPDRVIQFRIDWEDDEGALRVQRGYRVQWNDALGPYKGGLRFHPSVTPSVLKFLAFEQTFKNSLTGLALGGGRRALPGGERPLRSWQVRQCGRGCGLGVRDGLAASRQNWSEDKVDRKRKNVMQEIHERYVEYGETDSGRVDYAAGATRAAFARVADAVLRL